MLERGDERWVIVTGGTRGIGRRIVERLVADNRPVVFTYRDRAAASEVLDALRAQAGNRTGRAASYRCDLANPDEVAKFAARCVADHGTPYGLVCNAGVTADGLSSHLEIDTIRAAFQVNLFSAMQLVGSFARTMARARRGRIVFMSSISSALGNRGNGIYSATKGALESYMRSVLEEFARRGVTINSVLPGFIDTGIGGGYGRWREQILPRIPAQRLGTPDDVANVVSFLLSDGASYINGATLTVDGGVSATVGLAGIIKAQPAASRQSRSDFHSK